MSSSRRFQRGRQCIAIPVKSCSLSYHSDVLQCCRQDFAQRIEREGEGRRSAGFRCSEFDCQAHGEALGWQTRYNWRGRLAKGVTFRSRFRVDRCIASMKTCIVCVRLCTIAQVGREEALEACESHGLDLYNRKGKRPAEKPQRLSRHLAGGLHGLFLESVDALVFSLASFLERLFLRSLGRSPRLWGDGIRMALSANSASERPNRHETC